EEGRHRAGPEAGRAARRDVVVLRGWRRALRHVPCLPAAGRHQLRRDRVKAKSATRRSAATPGPGVLFAGAGVLLVAGGGVVVPCVGVSVGSKKNTTSRSSTIVPFASRSCTVRRWWPVSG